MFTGKNSTRRDLASGCRLRLTNAADCTRQKESRPPKRSIVHDMHYLNLKGDGRHSGLAISAPAATLLSRDRHTQARATAGRESGGEAIKGNRLRVLPFSNQRGGETQLQ